MNCYSYFSYFTNRQREILSLTQEEEQYRRICFAVKNGNYLYKTDSYCGCEYEQLIQHVKDEFRGVPEIEKGTVFVPVPSSDMTTDPLPSAWPSYDLATALNGEKIDLYVRRTVKVKKSSRAPGYESSSGLENNRTWEFHAGTMAIDPPDEWPKSICLVDDLLTFGGTLLGAMAAVRDAGFQGEIFAIAVGYTWSSELPRETRGLRFSLDGNRGKKRYRQYEGSWLK